MAQSPRRNYLHLNPHVPSTPHTRPVPPPPPPKKNLPRLIPMLVVAATRAMSDGNNHQFIYTPNLLFLPALALGQPCFCFFSSSIPWVSIIESLSPRSGLFNSKRANPIPVRSALPRVLATCGVKYPSTSIGL